MTIILCGPVNKAPILVTPYVPKWLFGLFARLEIRLLKVKYFRAKLSSSRSLLTMQLRGAVQGVVVGVYFKSHTYIYLVNGQWALISPKIGIRTIILGWRKNYSHFQVDTWKIWAEIYSWQYSQQSLFIPILSTEILFITTLSLKIPTLFNIF